MPFEDAALSYPVMAATKGKESAMKSIAALLTHHSPYLPAEDLHCRLESDRRAWLDKGHSEQMLA
jgi:hypothetical protein